MCCVCVCQREREREREREMRISCMCVPKAHTSLAFENLCSFSSSGLAHLTDTTALERSASSSELAGKAIPKSETLCPEKESCLFRKEALRTALFFLP